MASASASAHKGEYGRLRVAYDDDVRYYALAPEATLADLGNIFVASRADEPRRLHSVQITIVTEPHLG